MQAVILVGGKGSRLEPYTLILPKPLLPVGNCPIAEILVKQLKTLGFKEIIMCLGYLSELMVAYFQDGSRLGVPIRYSYESRPLGTAGPLKIINDLEENFLVINGDELTTLDFSALFQHHINRQADMTVAVQQKLIPSSLGVLDIKEGQVVGYSEKPTLNYWASMGIYVLNKRVLSMIPEGERFDMPELVQSLLNHQVRIISYESQDLWFDVGTLNDLEKAKKVFESD